VRPLHRAADGRSSSLTLIIGLRRRRRLPALFVAAFISARAWLEQSPVARSPSVFPDWSTNAACEHAKHIKREVDRTLDPEAAPSNGICCSA